MTTVAVAAEVAALEARMASEVAEVALLTDIEQALARLRRAYRADRTPFDPATVAKLQHAAQLALGLRLFIDLLDEWGEISDPVRYRTVAGDLGTLLTLFAGMPVCTRMRQQWVLLEELRPMIEVLANTALPPVAAPPPAMPDLFAGTAATGAPTPTPKPAVHDPFVL